MYILINLDEMTVLAKHPNMQAIYNLAHIECRHISYQITDIEVCLDQFTEMEMKILSRNCGIENYTGWKAVQHAIEERKETDLIPWELEVQASKILDTDPAIYKYQKGKHAAKRIQNNGGAYPKSEPQKIGKIIVASCLTSKVDMPTLSSTRSECSTLENQLTVEAVMAKKEAKAVQGKAKAATAKEAKPAKVKAEKAPVEKMPEQNGVRRPKPNTACGKVWELCDKLSAKLGSPTPVAPVFEKLVAEGMNGNNVKAEYARWRKFHGITGRVVAATEKAPKAAKAEKAKKAA